MDLLLLLELATNGALVGLMYSLVAMGIVLIYKSSSVPNLSQGALVMVAAYIFLAIEEKTKLPIAVTLILAAGVMFFLGRGVERFALRRLAGRPAVMILMMTLGVEIFVRAMSLSLWGASTRPMKTGMDDAPLLLGPILINKIFVVGALVAVATYLALELFFRSKTGVRLRAISDDYVASWSVGISVERGIGLSWGLSAVVATLAGVVWGANQGVDQSLSSLLLKGVTVAVLGGLDSLAGAVLAGLLLGVIEAVASGWLDELVGGGSRDLVVSLALILTIMVRPHGLFGRVHIERV